MSGQDLEALMARFARLIDGLGGAGPALVHLLEEAERRGACAPILADVRRLDAGPGDVLVVRFKARVPVDVQARLQHELAQVLGGAKALVLDDTVTAEVVREGRA